MSRGDARPFSSSTLYPSSVQGSVGQGAERHPLGPWLASCPAADGGPGRWQSGASSWASGLVQVWDPDAQEVEEHAFDAPINAIRFQRPDRGRVRQRQYHPCSRERSGARQVLVDGLAAPAPCRSQDEVWVSDQGDGKVWKIIEDATSLARSCAGRRRPWGPKAWPDGQGDLLVVEASRAHRAH